ncbi:hypothetical protein JCM6292_2727 [Bacteroides pyogenes JCM 6292]|uniref:Uncharacterized protein n=1 Tax=Bacteroides pyogenes JCM 6292 TaxID=1235809 RepID=W4PAA5_9BACE|nr:hypothetical protein JCM6292_2727 [Bacteroides pyogenes JCM 6292]
MVAFYPECKLNVPDSYCLIEKRIKKIPNDCRTHFNHWESFCTMEAMMNIRKRDFVCWICF